ncbi:UNVERIFIED_ORG: hypothetical protein M2312_003894 [Rhizobium esperanzae]|nr:hypothetical protein [Rhizobium esperanzae]
MPINATRMYAFNIVTLRGNNQSIRQNAADFRRLATGTSRISSKGGEARRLPEGKLQRCQDQKNDAAISGGPSSAWAMNSRAPCSLSRVIGPPRQTRTASGEAPSTVKASLATTPMPEERI